jgi:DNA-directed RNA polymerase specialized sigma24 family protein
MRQDLAYDLLAGSYVATTLLMRISKEVSTREIVDGLDVSLAATKSRVYRTRKRLL